MQAQLTFGEYMRRLRRSRKWRRYPQKVCKQSGGVPSV